MQDDSFSHRVVFHCGEMLDWEAPTGGYLLTACFASGYVAGNGVVRWIDDSDRSIAPE
jgi:predicted flavoprotein YhiN